MTCAQGLLRLLWGGPEVGVLRDCLVLTSFKFNLVDIDLFYSILFPSF